MLEPAQGDKEALEIVRPSKDHWLMCEKPQPLTYKFIDVPALKKDSVSIAFLCQFKRVASKGISVYLYQARTDMGGLLLSGATDSSGRISFTSQQLLPFNLRKTVYMFFDEDGHLVRKAL